MLQMGSLSSLWLPMNALKLNTHNLHWVEGRYGLFEVRYVWKFPWVHVLFLSTTVYSLQDVFDLPFHMARNQIEESLRNKMASIKVICFLFTTCSWCDCCKRGIIEVFCCLHDKFEGAHGSIARCSKRSRGYFWSNWEGAWAWSSTGWGKEHNPRAGLILSLVYKIDDDFAFKMHYMLYIFTHICGCVYIFIYNSSLMMMFSF